MAGPVGIFDPLALPVGWFDETAAPEGWFDADLLAPAAAPPPGSGPFSAPGRHLSAAADAELDGAFLRPLTFAELALDGGTLYLHNGIGTYTWSGHDWLGVGDFGGVDLIEEGEQASPFAVRLRLSGLDSTIAAEALTGDYHLRDVTLYIGFLGADNALIDDPDLIWSGQIDTMDIVAGAENQVLVTCESYLAKLDRKNGSLYTDADQRRRYSADDFFEYLPEMRDLRLIWAESRASTPGRAIRGPALPTRRGR